MQLQMGTLQQFTKRSYRFKVNYQYLWHEVRDTGLKLAVASHISIDNIDNQEGHLGGSACYCGLVCREIGLDTTLVTRVGPDFPNEMRDSLNVRGLAIGQQDDHFPTTRFYLRHIDDSRQLYLISKCSPLTINDVKEVDVDGWIVSPIIDEVPLSVLKEITIKNQFVALDPQGYLRKINNGGRVSMKKKIRIDLSGISAIKANEQEINALKIGTIHEPKFKILTKRSGTIRMGKYEITLDHFNESPDRTGLGDILTAAFTCAYIKERDPRWALCYGVGAIQAALETRAIGINKVPSRSQIEKKALYFFDRFSNNQH
jgi:sugar/nucleoside kinase (ribokinase family)